MEIISDREVVEGDSVDDKVGDGAVVRGEVVGDDDGDVFVDGALVEDQGVASDEREEVKGKKAELAGYHKFIAYCCKLI